MSGWSPRLLDPPLKIEWGGPALVSLFAQMQVLIQRAKHVVVSMMFAKDESSILSTSNQTKGFSFTTEAFF